MGTKGTNPSERTGIPRRAVVFAGFALCLAVALFMGLAGTVRAGAVPAPPAWPSTITLLPDLCEKDDLVSLDGDAISVITDWDSDTELLRGSLHDPNETSTAFIGNVYRLAQPPSTYSWQTITGLKILAYASKKDDPNCLVFTRNAEARFTLIQPDRGASNWQQEYFLKNDFTWETDYWPKNPATLEPWTWADLNGRLYLKVELRPPQEGVILHNAWGNTYCAELQVQVQYANVAQLSGIPGQPGTAGHDPAFYTAVPETGAVQLSAARYGSAACGQYWERSDDNGYTWVRVVSGSQEVVSTTFEDAGSGFGMLSTTLTIPHASQDMDYRFYRAVWDDTSSGSHVYVNSRRAWLDIQPDIIAPVITTPGDVTVEATSADGAVVTWDASAQDAAYGAVPVKCVPQSGSTFPVGTTTVTCTASDPAGNTASSSFTITVTRIPPVDGFYLVDDSATNGANRGDSWEDAFTDLQTALSWAEPGEDIWVAAGTYKPTKTNDRNASFALKAGVTLYGGFAGNESDSRDWMVYKTILSGDIGLVGNVNDDSYTVVRAIGLSAPATLEGFTITGGSGGTNGGGAGVYNLNSPLTLRNVVLTGNYAGYGGGMLNKQTSATAPTVLTNVVFAGNYATIGAGLSNEGATALITNAVFRGNVATAGGGGIFNGLSGHVELLHATFYGNSGGSSYGQTIGSAIHNALGGATTVKNSILWGNGPLEIRTDDSCPAPQVSYSIVAGGYPGTGVLSVSPQFVNAGAGDLHLTGASPAVDAGTAEGAPEFELDGGIRPLGGGFDMGAYEYWGPTGLVVQDHPGDNGQALDLSWTPSYPAATYHLYRSTSPGAAPTYNLNIGKISNYVDTGLTSGVTYYYTLRAEIGTALSPPSVQVSAAALDQGTTADVGWVGTGSDVSLETGGVELVFDAVEQAGSVTVSPVPATGTQVPAADFHLAGTAWDVQPVGLQFVGGVHLTFPYSDGDVPEGVAESSLTIMHFHDGVWTEVTDVEVDTDNNLITVWVESFSEFHLAVPNSAPVISAEGITAAPSLLPVGTELQVTAGFTDADSWDTTHEATWQWDQSGQSTTAGEISGGVVTGKHTYTAAGVYEVTLRVSDKAGAEDAESYRYVVVYDPTGGFVTGGGWIVSPAGALASDPALTGTASFGFVSRYQKGATVPSGNTQFQFQAGGLHFKSTSYDWLVIAGARAQYKGSGTINGAGSYGFMLTAVDGQVNGGGGQDKFRIKIWDKDNEAIVYDNQIDAADDAALTTVLGGGSIVIHK